MLVERSRPCVPQSIRSGDRGGTILVTGGGFAIYPNADWLSLSIGKTGGRALALALAPELAKKNIRVGISRLRRLSAPAPRKPRM